MRRDVLTGTDNDVFDPAGDEEVAAGHIGAIAGIEPSIVEQLAGLGRVLEIARRRRRTPKFESTFPAFSEFTTHLVDDSDFVIGDRLPTSDNLDGIGVIRPRGLGHPVRG